MKKVFALLLVLVLACALCVPALAVGTAYSQAELQAMVAKAPADVQGVATQVVNGLTGGLTVDVDQVKGIYNSLKNTLATEKDAGKIKTAIENAAQSMQTATGLTFENLSVTVDAVTGKVSVTADVLNGGTKVVTATGTGKAALINNSGSSGSGSSSNTTSNTAAAAASVIKATGVDASAVVVVVLAIAGVLGVATVKARKLD